MTFVRKMLAVVLCLAAAFCFGITVSANASSAISNVYSITEYEELSEFDMAALDKTSAFFWKLNGEEPVMKTENGLPGYVLYSEKETGVAKFTSTPASSMDVYAYRQISFMLRVTLGENEFRGKERTVTLTLRSGDETLVCTGEIECGGWKLITFDIGSWKYRKSITEITLRIEGDSRRPSMALAEMSGPYVRHGDTPTMEKFMSYGLYASGSELAILDRGTDSESLMVYLGSGRITVSGSAAVPYTGEHSNAVRIVMTNDSELQNMQFSYSYLDTSLGKYVNTTKNVTLEPGTGRFSYFVITDEVTLINSFSLILDSSSEGSVTIHSIEPVAIYEGDTSDHFGSLTACFADSSGKTVTIEGSVYHSYLVSHDDHTLVCYVLRTGETFKEILARGDRPAAEAKMSSRFSFELKTDTLGEYALVSKYAVAAISPGGEHTLLAPPISVSGDFGTADAFSGRTNIKGLSAEYISTAVDSGVGTSIVDIYLDELTNDTHGGHLYTIEDTHIYFDASYVTSLDNKIKNLSASGCKVYLRLLISASADTSLIPYATDAGAGEDTELLAVNICDRDAEKHFYATVNFLARRYSDSKNGKISGLVLGKTVDMMEKYNYSGDLSLASYTETLASALELMARTAVRSIPGIEIILPISDSRGGINGFDSELLLTSVCRYLEMGGGLEFSLMLEGAHIPYSLRSDMFDLPESSEEGDEDDEAIYTPIDKAELIQANEYSEYYCTDNLYTFERLLDYLSKISSSAPGSYIYFWSPDVQAVGNGLTAAYVYNYYSIMFSEKASAFVVSFSDDEMGEKGVKKLSYLMKYIDTERNSDGSLCLSALEVFGENSWEALIDGYDEELISYRVFHEVTALDALPETVKGSYALWDFSTAFGVLDWFEGNGCDTVYVDATAMGSKSLCAELSDFTGTYGYSDIVYNYVYPEAISLLPYIEFDLTVDDGRSGALYEVTVILGGSGHRLEAKKTVYSGQASVLIVPTAAHEEMEQIDFIRICLRRISGGSVENVKLYLEGVNAYSEKYDNEGLAKAIATARAKARNTAVSSTDAVIAEPNYDIIIAVAFLIPLSVIMIGFYDKNRNKKVL